MACFRCSLFSPNSNITAYIKFFDTINLIYNNMPNVPFHILGYFNLSFIKWDTHNIYNVSDSIHNLKPALRTLKMTFFYYSLTI